MALYKGWFVAVHDELYKDIIYLNLPTLKYRRLRGDVIEVFKITHNIYHTTVSPDLSFNERANTRGNNYKLIIILFIVIYESMFSLHAL